MQYNTFKAYLIILTLLFQGHAKGQVSSPDSLIGSLNRTQAGELVQDTSTVNQLLDIFAVHRFSNSDSATKYADLALDMARRLEYTKGILKASYSRGSIFFTQGEYQKIFDLANEALDGVEPEQYHDEQAKLYQLLGIAHASQGSYEPGLRYFFKAKEMFDAAGDDLGSFQNLNNIGVSYLKIEDYDRALDIFLEIDSLRTLSPETISVPVNLGFIYYELGEYQKAIDNLMRVITFDAPSFDRRSLGLANFKLGEVYRAMGEYDLALDYFNQSIEAFDNLNNEVQKIQAYNGIAQTYLKTGNLSRAEEYALLAFEQATEYDNLPHKKDAAGTLQQVYSLQNNYEEAYEYLKLFETFADSLQNDEISKEIGRIEAEFEFQRRELELINAQKQQNIENAQQLAVQRSYLIVTIALLIIAIVVAYLGYRNSSLRKKANKLLQEKNDKIEAQAAKLQEMNEVKNQLFSIISHDLKGPLSSLYGFLTLNEMGALDQNEINKLIPELSNRFRYTSNLLNNLLNWSRSQLEGYTTDPELVPVTELFSESSKVLRNKADQKNITIENNIDSDVKVYADRNMIELVFLNLISNAIKFTPEGGQICITSSSENGTSTICIKDNGVGISEDKLDELFRETSFYTSSGTNNEKGTGLGLMLCIDFIERNNGSIWADSEKGKGSTFCFRLPSGIEH